MSSFKKLRIWQESVQLAKEIYLISSKGKFSRDFGLKDQLRRAAISISSNIAEGEESGYKRKKILYLNIAKGSAAEVVTQIIIAKEVGHISQKEEEYLENLTHKIIASIKKYKHSLN